MEERFALIAEAVERFAKNLEVLKRAQLCGVFHEPAGGKDVAVSRFKVERRMRWGQGRAYQTRERITC
jgi:hypothetical protein